MKIREIMTDYVVRIHPEESVAVAARQLARYNIGALPVCGNDGRLCGVVTDRDLVTRCMALERPLEKTRVREVMTSAVTTVTPETNAAMAAALMGHKQVRRLPVVEDGKVCGMVSLSDFANCESLVYDAAEALSSVSNNVL